MFSSETDDLRQQLEQAIAVQESLRGMVDDAVIDATIASIKSQLAALEPSAQQRKLATILFMDIAGSTSIAQDMDPEEVREVFDVALNRLAKPVEAHGGHVTRFMGDGFLAVFGAPQAREDDPERAIRAGLDIIKTAQELAEELRAEWSIPDFQVRVGINTGLVALGGLTEADDTLMGAAVNLAARLESAAPAGGLLVSHDTYRHVRGIFNVEPQEPIQAKGFPEPVHVYQVLRLRPRSFYRRTRGVEGVETRMIGRDPEFLQLKKFLKEVLADGERRMVTVLGEAGIGKSRLLYEFENWVVLRQDVVRLYKGRARLDTQGVPYALLSNLFSFRFQIHDDDSSQIIREKLEDGFTDAYGDRENGELQAHIVGQMLGYDFRNSPHLVSVLEDPQQLRARAVAYLGRYFKAVASQAPVLILLEDLHWADDSSLKTLNQLALELTDSPVFILAAARYTLLERRPNWGDGQDFHRRVLLGPLSIQDSRRLVGEVLQKIQDIPQTLLELLVAQAEGNPFYVEELVKMLVDQDVIIRGEPHWRVAQERLSGIQVPPTLMGVLQARLDGLPGNEKKLLQQASVVGRVFWDKVLEYMVAKGDQPARDRRIAQELAGLCSRELVFPRESSAFSETQEYIFKHALLQEVAYESVLKRFRRIYHAMVAEWLEEYAGERAEDMTGILADHLEQAGDKEKAKKYLLKAGQKAAEGFANAEALVYYQRALALTEGKEEADRILALRAKAFLDLFQGPEATKDYTRLLEHARQSGNQKDELAALLGLAAAYYILALDDPAFISQSLELYEQANTLAGELGDKAARIRALVATMWFPNYWPEIRAQVVANIERAWTLSQEIADEDLMIDCMIARAQYDLVPVEQVEELLARLEARRDLPRLMQASFRLTWRYLFIGNFARCVEHCDTSIKLAEKLGTPPVMYATIKALALLGLGRYDAAWKSLQEEIAGAGYPLGNALKDFGTGMYLAGLMVHSEAISVFENVIKQAKQVGRAWLSLWAQAELSKSQLKSGRLEEINLDWTTQDLETDIVLTADALALLGEIALIHGDLDEALRQAEKAVAYADAHGWKPAQVLALVLQLKILLKMDRLRDVIILADKGIQITEEMNHRPLLWRLLAAKTQALARLGEIEIAAENYRDAAAVIRELAGAIGDPQLKQLFLSNALVASVLKGEA